MKNLKTINIDSELISFSLTDICNFIINNFNEIIIHEICQYLKINHKNIFLDSEREAIKNYNSIEEIERYIVFQMIYNNIWKLKINQIETIGNLIGD